MENNGMLIIKIKMHEKEGTYIYTCEWQVRETCYRHRREGSQRAQPRIRQMSIKVQSSRHIMSQIFQRLSQPQIKVQKQCRAGSACLLSKQSAMQRAAWACRCVSQMSHKGNGKQWQSPRCLPTKNVKNAGCNGQGRHV